MKTITLLFIILSFSLFAETVTYEKFGAKGDGKIDDSAYAPGKPGPFIFGNFNHHKRDESYQEKFPYRITEEVILKNVTTKSGKQVAICPNPFMFKDIKIIRQ